jgi:hypothetical protein
MVVEPHAFIGWRHAGEQGQEYEEKQNAFEQGSASQRDWGTGSKPSTIALREGDGNDGEGGREASQSGVTAAAAAASYGGNADCRDVRIKV